MYSLIYCDMNYPDGLGDWDSTGCIVSSRDLDIVTCSCNHLSIFGVHVVSFDFILYSDDCGKYVHQAYYLIQSMQNTNPIQCEFGFFPNNDRTDCDGM